MTHRCGQRFDEVERWRNIEFRDLPFKERRELGRVGVLSCVQGDLEIM